MKTSNNVEHVQAGLGLAGHILWDSLFPQAAPQCGIDNDARLDLSQRSLDCIFHTVIWLSILVKFRLVMTIEALHGKR